MPYSVPITRATPTCVLFLVDQSSSMHERIQGRSDMPRKSEFITDALNKTIANLILQATVNEPEPRRYYQVGVIGYGNTVGSTLGDALGWQDLAWIDELYAHPLRIEERVRTASDGAGGVVELPVKFPVWFEPVANGQTPMCQALDRARGILETWVQQHRNSYPPVVINFTDGEANDGDPRVPAQAIRSLETDDGNVLLMTLHVSSSEFGEVIEFPHDIRELPDDSSRVMFAMTSPLPQTDFLRENFRKTLDQELLEGTKAFVYRADIARIVKFLNISTPTPDKGMRF